MNKKHFIVTGGAGNLGSATITKLIQEGHSVSGIVSHGKSLPEQNGLFSYQADLSKEIESTSVIEKIVSDHKIIDGAVLTVGGFAMGSIDKTSVEDLQKMIELNFYTAYTIVRPLLEHLKNQKTGRLVLVGSRPALESNRAKGSIAYSLSKSLIFKLSELINEDCKALDITSSIIVPDIIDTPTNRKDMPNADFTKWTSPEKIASTIYSVLSGEQTSDVIKFY